MGRQGKEIYDLEEARKVARGMNLRNREEYRKSYSKFPMLPSEPDRKYGGEWRGWENFLGVEELRYTKYHDASAAAQELGIKTAAEYRKRYREDEYLAPAPDVFYEDCWSGWSIFLGKGQYQPKYETIKEASKAARVLEIKTKEEYESRYLEDPQLPVSPHKTYKDTWGGWEKYLGTENEDA